MNARDTLTVLEELAAAHGAEVLETDGRAFVRFSCGKVQVVTYGRDPIRDTLDMTFREAANDARDLRTVEGSRFYDRSLSRARSVNPARVAFPRPRRYAR